jgi:YYY domain-containing protein
MMQVTYAICWWLIIEVIGWLSFPLVSRVCGSLADRGYAISKLVGMVLLTFLCWLISSLHLLPFGYISLVTSFILLGAISLFLGRKQLSVAKANIKSILITELIFTATFLVFVIILMHKPDVYFNGGEYFMNFGFTQSVLRSDYFPPVDPWFAGESISYYYGGHLLVANLSLLSHVPAAISFNLVGATFPALAVAASYGLGYNMTRRKLYGAVTAVFVCFVGYISGAFQFIGYIFNSNIFGYSAIEAANVIDWMRSFDFWTAIGVIPDTLSLYPYYGFLQRELHAIIMAIPFQIMFITLVFARLKKADSTEAETGWGSLLGVFVLGITLGFLSLVNTWAYPVYVVLIVGAAVLLKLDKKAAIGIVALSVILYLPYYLSRGYGAVDGLGWVTERTTLSSFLEIFALFFFVLVSFFAVLGRARLFSWKIGVPIAVATLLAALLLEFHLLLIVVPTILLSLYYLYQANPEGERRFILFLLIIGALLVLFCDLFYVNDPFGPPFERFNTILKLYLEIWIFFGIAAAYAVFSLWNRLKGKIKMAWVGVLLLLVLASSIHPIAATTSWTSGRHTFFGINSGTLDGVAYIESINKGDYKAIQWIDEEIEGLPVILEAPGNAYEYSSRISAMTGLPTVIGWQSHEVMWRGDWGAVQERTRDVDTIYNTVDHTEAVDLMRKYDVEYVYIGALEREQYGMDVGEKFGDFMDVVFENEGVTIYQVREE